MFKIEKIIVCFASYSALILVLLAGTEAGRHMHYDVPDQLVTDGHSDGNVRQEGSSLLLKGMDSSEEQCRQMYGFLPCSSNLPGHMFLIVIYEYLLYHGESYAGGDGRIFHVFGNNFVVSSFSQLLDSLPESLILLVSGLLSSNDEREEYVITGIGLLAGSSIFLLTVLWGICFICASHKFYVKTGSKENKNVLKLLNDYGVHTDSETNDHAKIMLFSVIPFIIILIPRAFDVPYSSKTFDFVVLISLVIAVCSLCCYFYYQCNDKKIHERILEYAKLERKIEMHVPFYEVQTLMRKRDKHLIDKQIEMEKKLQPLKDGDMMRADVFLGMFNSWIDSTRISMDDPYKSETEFNQVAQLLLEEKIKVSTLISEMIDVNQDESSINTFFDGIDANGDLSVSPSELKDFIISQKGDGAINDIVDELVEIIMERLDADENGKIEKDEFKSRALICLKVIRLYIELSHVENEKKERFEKATAKERKEGMCKAVVLLVLGILMLTVLVEPLTHSVRVFSESMKIAPFYVSFILVPLATNARTAIAAIRAATQKKHHTTSLTFSEIYHKVFMNNILGFSVLVSVIYFRGLTWHFSAEVLVLVIVCIIMGILASLRLKFPIWTLSVVFPLYPLSLVLVHNMDDSFKNT